MMDDVTEEDLHAYVDGALQPERQRRVKAYLGTHPEAAARVAAWQRQKGALHAAFDPVLDEPIPPRLQDIRAPRPWRHAAALAWLALGVVVGWMARGSGPAPPAVADLVREAAVAHVVYSPEVLHPVEVYADQQSHLVKWLSKRLGAPIRVPDLAAAGYQLVGGRLLPSHEGAAAQLMYQDAAGHRLTLYLRSQVPGAADTAFRYEEREGVGVFCWVDGPFGYALTGVSDRKRLLGVAKLVYDQLG